MAQLAFGVGGAAVGSTFGQAGLGFTAGSLLYSFLNPPDDIINEGPRLNNQLTTTSAYGLMRPIIYGTMPVNGNIIDASQLYETRHESKQDAPGKGFGGGQKVVDVSYTYSVDLAVALGQGPLDGLIKIYANDKLIYDASQNSTIISPPWLVFRFYPGDESQLPDPTLQVLHGADTPAYRGEAYVVFTRFELADFNNQIPNFRFLVISKSTPQQSFETKPHSGTEIGGLAHDRYSSLIYFVSWDSTNNVIGYIYDPRTENPVLTIRLPDDVSSFEQGGGIALLSLAQIAAGVRIESGANSHLLVQTQDSTQPKFSIYDSKTGAYKGSVDNPVGTDANTVSVISDERKGFVYRTSGAFLYSWELFLSGSILEPVTSIDRGQVTPPLPGKETQFEWAFYITPSYPEGTSRDGLICIHGWDIVDSDNYVCLLDDSNATFVSNYALDSDFAAAGITIIVWDSVQRYFWVLGNDATNDATTRIKAYDENLTVQYSENWTTPSHLPLYTNAARLTTYDAATFSLWLYDYLNGTIFKWNTITHVFEEEYTGYPSGGFGTSPGFIYVNYTRSAWRKKTNADLDIYRFGRLSDEGLTLDQVVGNLCERAGLQLAQYDVSELASATVDGYKIDSDGTIRSKLVPLQQTYLFDGIDKGDKIDFKFRGQSLEDTIPKDDLGAESDSFIEIDRIMDLDLPGKTEITYYNRTMEYEQNTQMARRWASNVKENSVRMTLPVVITDDEGIRLADITEHMAYIEREQYQVSVLPRWQYLAVGDVIDINTGTKIYHARVVEKSFENGVVSLSLTRENSSILQSFLNGGQAPGRDVAVEFNILMYAVYLDIPLLLESQDNAGHYLSACGMGQGAWSGGNIYKSPDGSNFNLSLSVLKASTIGSVIEALPADSSGTVWDRTTQLTVNLISGTLSSLTEEQVLQGLGNTAVVGVHGRWEVIGFVNVTPLAGSSYRLDTLVRGRLGTEWTTDIHTGGEIFCMLSLDDLSYLTDSVSNIGTQFLFRAVSFGENLYGERVFDTFHTNTGVCLKPYAPAHFQDAKDSGTFDVTFSWMPRSRYIWRDYWTGMPSNLNNFEIDITLPDASLKTLTVTDAITHVYPRSEQLSDGFPASTYVTLATIYHMSQGYPTDGGRGYPTSLSVELGPPGVSHPYQQRCIELGVDLLWTLDEDSKTLPVMDISGNVRHGTFDDKGTSMYVEVQQASAYTDNAGYSVKVEGEGQVHSELLDEFGVETISFGGFFRVNAVSSNNDENIFGLFNTGIQPPITQGFGTFLRVDADYDLEIQHMSGTDAKTLYPTDEATLGTWHHAIITIGPERGVSFFFEGKLTFNDINYTKFVTVITPMMLNLGKEPWINKKNINSKNLDNIGIWLNKELSEAQVKSLNDLR